MAKRLVLQPELKDIPLEELEQRLEAIRARRIMAAMEYVAGQNLKLEIEKDKLHRKLKAQYEMLAKELERCERAIYVCEERVAGIIMLKDEAGVLEDY